MKKNDIPIWRDASQLLLETERAVRHFTRYHKYTLGTEMRQQAMKICQLVSRAWRDKAHTADILPRLVLAVDDLKIQLQLGGNCRRSAISPSSSNWQVWQCGWVNRERG